MIHLSQNIITYPQAANELFAAFSSTHTPFRLLPHTRDVWLRDFMPVRTRSGRYVSFTYRPWYLSGYPSIRTDFRRDLATFMHLPGLVYSKINLDGGNIVFSPARTTAVVSDRVFAENPKTDRDGLLRSLEELLETRVIVIPSLPRELDMTGHADGMFRFVTDTLALVNRIPDDPLEAEIRRIAEANGISVIEMPFVEAKEIAPDATEISAAGCYINFLETEDHVFVPAFGIAEDAEAAEVIGKAFGKEAVQVRCDDLADDGGVLNCVTWEE